MSAFDNARREIVAALLMDYHRNTGEIQGFEELDQVYSLKTKEEWFDPIISEIEHLLIVSRTYDGVAVKLHPRGYGELLRETLQNLQATSLEISWPKEEVLSDATDYRWFPIPKGWKWFQYKGDESSFDPPGDPKLDSASWTGLPSGFALTEDKRQQLVRELDRAEEALQSLEISQELRSQARAYIVASRVLAEAPEPPVDLIWQLMGRANSIAGIASLLVAIVGLFT